MLRVNVGLSRKVSKDYNSTGYSVNLDGEVTAAVSDPEAVIEQVKQLYDLADEALNQQIERAQSDAAIGSRDEAPPRRTEAPATNGHRPAPNGRPTSNGTKPSGNGRPDEPATNKQIQFLLSIGKQQGLSTPDLEQKIVETLGYEVGLYDLTKRDAGRVLDMLTNKPSNGRAAARR